MDEKIPIKQGGKVVGYVNSPLWLHLWQTLKYRRPVCGKGCAV